MTEEENGSDLTVSHDEADSAVPSADINESLVESRFWVSTGPYFFSTLFIIPPDSGSGLSQGFSVVEIFDVDGVSAGVTRVRAKNGVMMIELSSLMSSCKEESGMQYGQLVVRSPAGYAHYCRMHNESRAFLIPPIKFCQAGSPLFSPLTIGAGKDTFLGLVNTGDTDANLRCRLYFGKRTPEIDCSIPAHGSRILHVESVFGGFVQLGGPELSYAYIRCMTRVPVGLGVHVFERCASSDGKDFYTAVS